MEGLTSLYAEKRGISDLTGLKYAMSLVELHHHKGQISDISPLVDNEGLSEGDGVYLQENPPSCDSINIHIPQLEARGVTIEY